VRFLDREGKQQELAAEGLLATVVQHEIDHLNGRLIIDFLSRLKRDIIVRRFKKLAKETAVKGVRPLASIVVGSLRRSREGRPPLGGEGSDLRSHARRFHGHA
jgi:hypothetical protein